ncbi:MULTISPECIES: hypothetical protein [unclassified Streptomyces]|uniref:hypothetical protein n=1 Tax=unclassified Streptomyces TaxID=2593676 RepID=UPI00226EE8D2|nr:MULTISPECIES: hypothetical protein [unclassified Streptomyces]MCY0919606.1 hypothetical protein [Streptomyces sp. H27-G5]MCY0957212.1 hypothetical protein [Streptomyces sp. H27-H5]
MSAPDTPPLPQEPHECRARAEEHLAEPADPAAATAWALLAVAGELAAIRRALHKRR